MWSTRSAASSPTPADSGEPSSSSRLRRAWDRTTLLGACPAPGRYAGGTTPVAPEALSPSGNRPVDRWRIVAASSVLATLSFFVVFQLSQPGPVAAPIGTPAERAPAALPTDDATPGIAAIDEDAEVLAAAEAALTAWGAFASTGDVEPLAAHFHTDGPQYRQLLSEAPRIAAAPVEDRTDRYELTLVDPVVVDPSVGPDRTVSGDVVLTRGGETAARYEWDLLLRPTGTGTWAIWTVTDRE